MGFMGLKMHPVIILIKIPKNLDLNEATMLAGVVNGPELFFSNLKI